MTKAQESVQDRRWHEVSVQYQKLWSVSIHDQSSVQDQGLRTVCPILRVMVSLSSWPKLKNQSKIEDDMKFQSNTMSYVQCQFLPKAQLSVQDQGLREVLVQDQALHCFSPRSDAASTDKGSQGLHHKQTVGSTYLESTNLQHLILLPSVPGRSWSP